LLSHSFSNASFSKGGRLDDNAVFSGDGRNPLDAEAPGCGSGIQFGEHLIKAAAWRTQNEYSRWLVANIADGMASVPRTEKEAPTRETVRRAFEFDDERSPFF
jgi:hypothetical protein